MGILRRDVDLTVTDLGGGTHRIAWDLKEQFTQWSLASGQNDFPSTSSAQVAMRTTLEDVQASIGDYFPNRLLWPGFATKGGFHIRLEELTFARGISVHVPHRIEAGASDNGNGTHDISYSIWRENTDGTETAGATGTITVTSADASTVTRARLRALLLEDMRASVTAADLTNDSATITPVERPQGVTLNEPYTVSWTVSAGGGGTTDFTYSVTNGSSTEIGSGALNYPDTSPAATVLSALIDAAQDAVSATLDVQSMAASFTLPFSPPDFKTGILNAPYTIDVTVTDNGDGTHAVAHSVKNNVPTEIGSDSNNYANTALAKVALLVVYEAAKDAVAAELAVSAMGTTVAEELVPDVELMMGCAFLPRERIDITDGVPTTARSVTVKTSEPRDYASVQSALNNEAETGDVTILVDSNVESTSTITLPARTHNSPGWVVIKTSDATLPAFGTRVAASDSSKMPTIKTPTTNNARALEALAGANHPHHYWMAGLEFQVNNTSQLGRLIELNSSGTTTNTPHHLVFDRCIFDNTKLLDAVQRGISLQSAFVAVLSSRFQQFRHTGQDAQALAGWNGPHTARIENNFLEATGENILWGGAPTNGFTNQPRDIEIRRNYFFKPNTWNQHHVDYAGIDYSIKNHYETKSVKRNYIVGNVANQTWKDAQTFSMALHSTQQGGGSNPFRPWEKTIDLVFVFNWVKNASAAISISGAGNGIGPALRWFVAHNICEEIGRAEYGGVDGVIDFVSNSPKDLWYRNNTIEFVVVGGSGNMVTTEASGRGKLLYVNNISKRGSYGFKGTGHTEGTNTLNNDWVAGWTFRSNVISDDMTQTQINFYPANNYFTDNDDFSSVGFIDYVNDNYRLNVGTPYLGIGTDGLDPGADQDAVDAAISGVEE